MHGREKKIKGILGSESFVYFSHLKHSICCAEIPSISMVDERLCASVCVTCKIELNTNLVLYLIHSNA